MTDQTKISVNTATVGELKSFFDTGGLLTRACRECGIEHINIRRGFAGPHENMRLEYVVKLKNWVLLWINQEAERKALAGSKL